MTIKTVVVAGGGLAGWTCALALVTKLKSAGISVKLVNHPVIESEVDCCLASVRSFHSLVKLNELVLLNKSIARLHLGTRYVGFRADGESFFLPNSPIGMMINGIPFHHYATLLHQCGDHRNFERFSVNALMCEQQKFNFLNDSDENDYQLNVSLQLKTNEYCAYLSELSVKRGVVMYPSSIRSVIRDEIGNISALTLDDGSNLGGEFFIDATGVEALLSQAVDPQSRNPINVNAIDRYLEGIVSDSNKTCLSAEIRAVEGGYIKLHNLPEKRNVHFYYRSHDITDEAALCQLETQIPSIDLASVRVRQLECGYRGSTWIKNCVAIGTAAAELGGLFSSPLHLAQSAVLRLLELFPLHLDDAYARDEFNRLTQEELKRVIDFLHAHFLLQKNFDFNDAAGSLEPSHELAHKISLFKKRGIVAFNEQETWLPSQWVSLFLGLNCWPEKYDPKIENLGLEKIASILQSIQDEVDSIVDAMPRQDVFFKHLASVGTV